jgi:uncharacterized protein
MQTTPESYGQSAGRRLIGLCSSAAARSLIAAIQAYRIALSPFVGHHCRFHPSCSHYAMECIRLHGALRGTLLTMRRLLKCHPWHEGGIDHVPQPTHRSCTP